MNFTDYKQLVAGLTVGKKLPTATYLHTEALSTAPGSLQTMLETLRTRLGIGDDLLVVTTLVAGGERYESVQSQKLPANCSR